MKEARSSHVKMLALIKVPFFCKPLHQSQDPARPPQRAAVLAYAPFTD